jgi:hypothetical protein
MKTFSVRRKRAMEMSTSAQGWQRLLPVVVLLLIAPIVAEVFSGSTSITTLFGVLFEIGLYGAAAVLIRELVCRRGLGWPRLMIFGLVYGLIQEGLLLQTLFDPHFPGLGQWTIYGRAFGINWGWAVYILGFHALWSISIPILLVELLFPKFRGRPWLRWPGLSVVAAVFLLYCFVTALVLRTKLFSGSVTSPFALVGVAVLIVGGSLCALFIPASHRQAQPAEKLRRAPSSWIILVASFVVGWLWFQVYGISKVPVMLPLLAWGVLAIVLISSLLMLWTPGRRWHDVHTLGFVAGMLLACLVTGFNLEASRGWVAVVGHAVLTLVTIALLAWLGLRLRKVEQESESCV